MPPPHRKQAFRLKSGHTIPEAIRIAKELTKKDLYHIGDPEMANELAELGYPGEEGMSQALLIALGEIEPEDYRPPRDPHPNPGIPFVWNSKCFNKRMYLKFKLVGSRPALWWYSCHEAYL